MRTLDEIGTSCMTDKAHHAHDFLRVYDQFLTPLRDQPITFLEIGIQNGFSLKMWREYFVHERAIICDIDNIPECRQHTPAGCTAYIGDQADPLFLRGVAAAHSHGFDVILDDGSHQSGDQITSFGALWPSVKVGGLYIIEDVKCSYHREYAPDPKVNIMHVLKGLADAVNVSGKGEPFGSRERALGGNLNLTDYERTVGELHFYGGMCIIRKDSV